MALTDKYRSTPFTLGEVFGAIERATQHWYNNASGSYEGHSSSQCALCDIFLNRITSSCQACPIKVETGQNGCHGTPYFEYARYLNEHHVYVAYRIRAKQPAAQQLAWKEHEFLTKLGQEFRQWYPDTIFTSSQSKD